MIYRSEDVLPINRTYPENSVGVLIETDPVFVETFFKKNRLAMLAPYLQPKLEKSLFQFRKKQGFFSYNGIDDEELQKLKQKNKIVITTNSFIIEIGQEIEKLYSMKKKRYTKLRQIENLESLFIHLREHYVEKRNLMIIELENKHLYTTIFSTDFDSLYKESDREISHIKNTIGDISSKYGININVF